MKKQICLKTYYENFINNQTLISKCVVKLAIHEAECSTMNFKIGAVLFKGDRILSSGHNKRGSGGSIHPKYQNKLDSIHAEQDCLLGLDWKRLKNHNIFTLRLNQSGMINLAKPCDMCFDMIKHIGLKGMYYTNRHCSITYEKL